MLQLLVNCHLDIFMDLTRKLEQSMDFLDLFYSRSYSSFFEEEGVKSHSSSLLFNNKKRTLVHVLSSSPCFPLPHWKAFHVLHVFLIFLLVIYRKKFITYNWSICLHVCLVLRCITISFYLH